MDGTIKRAILVGLAALAPAWILSSDVDGNDARFAGNTGVDGSAIDGGTGTADTAGLAILGGDAAV
jgi:hypothetical protein